MPHGPVHDNQYFDKFRMMVRQAHHEPNNHLRCSGVALISVRSGVRDAERLRTEIKAVLNGEPLVENIDYASVADVDSLDELEQLQGPGQGRAMASVAVRIGRTRLIDNVILE